MTTHLPFRSIGSATIIVTALAAAGGTSIAANPAAERAATSTTTSPWSQTDYNAAQSRANLAEKILTRSTLGKIRFLRGLAVPLDPDACSAEIDSLALSGNSLYTSADGFLIKYDVATGQLLWKRSTNFSVIAINSWIAVGNGLVVTGGSDCGSASDPRGVIQAFSTTTGKLVWTRDISPLGGALDQLVVSGGLVISAGDSPGSGPQLSVRRIASGALVWGTTLTSGIDASCDGNVLVVAQVVIAPGGCDAGSNALVGRKISNGAKLWSRPGIWTLQRGDAASSAGRHVLVTNPKGTILSLNPLTGKTQHALKGAASVLAVGSAQAYTTCGPSLLSICAYSTATGSLRWRTGTAGPGPVAEAGGVLYLGDGLILSPGNGSSLRSQLWHGATLLAVGNGRIAVVLGPTAIDVFGLKGS